MSRWSTRIALAGTLIASVATLSGTHARADGLNLCAPSNQTPAISLPADEAPHSVPVEWYYTTGHLATPSGKRYGYETVVFQLATPSGGFVTVGQVAVTDLNNGTFHHQSYLAPGPFPASTNGFNVAMPQGLAMSGGNGSNHVTASLPDGYSLDLSLGAITNPVYQHGNGLFPFVDPSTGTQIASMGYYSRPRMATVGTVTSPTGTEVAAGQSWFDHQYGTLPPADWEWYSIQLNDGSNIMAVNARQPHTRNSYATFGSIQDPLPGCAVQSLGPSDFTMSLRGAWTSPHTGIAYPNQFGLSVPSRGMSLSLTPQLADQEVSDAVAGLAPYWEGTVRVSGTVNGHPVSGVGYVELVEA